MFTFTGSIDLYKILTKNSETSNVTLGTTMINEGIRKIASKRAWDFLYDSEDDTTVASQQFYNLPWDYKKLQSVTVTIDSTTYTPIEAPDRTFWDRLNQSNATKSDTPEYFFIRNGQLGFYPTPSSGSNTITYHYKKRIRDISIADVTTGTLTVTNGSKTITGAGTTFTAGMVGRWIKLNDEKDWYKIGAFTSTTVISLVRDYDGVDASGENFTLGEISLLPEDYQILPIYYAVYNYWDTIGDNPSKASDNKVFFDEGLIEMIEMFGSKSDNPVIETGLGFPNNPNLFVTK